MVTAYLRKVTQELRLPAVGKDKVGITWAAREKAPVRVEDKTVERYRTVEDYDPVLKAHCRLE